MRVFDVIICYTLPKDRWPDDGIYVYNHLDDTTHCHMTEEEYARWALKKEFDRE